MYIASTLIATGGRTIIIACFLMETGFFIKLTIMQHIQNIIFDYGNVIFDIDFNRLKVAFSELGISERKEVFIHGGQHQLFDALDRGEVTPAQFRAEIRKLAENPDLTDRQIDDAWNRLLVGIPAGNNGILLELKPRYRTFLLSNNNEIHYNWIMDYLNREFKVPDNTVFFEKDYYSHLMGMRKPDAAIFEFVLEQHGLKPAETLFIDDLPDNLAAAQKLRMQTALSKNAAGFSNLLTALKIR